MVKYPSLTKTCASCGQEKPLSAFMQIGSLHGSIYGNICATCRKTNMNKKAGGQDDDRTTSKSDHAIDSKVKVAAEIDKKERFKEAEELYHKERALEEDKLIKHDLKTEETDLKNKKHREQISTKKIEKRSMFDNSFITSPEVPAEKVFGGEAQLTKEREINFSEVADARTKYTNSQNYSRLKAFLGERSLSPTERAKLLAERTAKEKGTNPTAEKEEPIPDTIRKTWGKPGK